MPSGSTETIGSTASGEAGAASGVGTGAVAHHADEEKQGSGADAMIEHLQDRPISGQALGNSRTIGPALPGERRDPHQSGDDEERQFRQAGNQGEERQTGRGHGERTRTAEQLRRDLFAEVRFRGGASRDEAA